MLDCLGNSACIGEAGDSIDPQTIKDIETGLNTYLTVTYALGAVLTALWVYPSVFLAVEIKKGIMTKQTYPREEMSCCCVQK